jgi:GNAT superfamily N-acetyltransferase
VRIEEVAPGDARLVTDLLPVLAELRPHLTADLLTAVYAEGHQQGLRFTAAYDRDQCVGVAGWRIHALTLCGRKLYVDDLVTAESARSTGVGAALLADLESRARTAGCSVLDLDSAVHRHRAHRFYFREGMQISGYHFTSTL